MTKPGGRIRPPGFHSQGGDGMTLTDLLAIALILTALAALYLESSEA